jgi:LmbE family N-acetylglucosaminyl deacetylase
MPVSRRTLLAAAATAPLLRSRSEADTIDPPAPRLKVVVAGGHPGDPECGCGGTISRYTHQGHEVVLFYLNRGEGYCGGAKLNDCATIRTAEAQKACRILKSRAVFAGQHDGRAVLDNSHYDDFRRQLDTERPDVVFTHWPIDQHRDHRAMSNLVLDAWLQSKNRFVLYYYEVAGDTLMFSSAEYVDISSVVAQRREACYAHASQNPDKWYPEQEQITRFRGMESGHLQAEGFVRHWQSKGGLLP